jgi:hypothetical protein
MCEAVVLCEAGSQAPTHETIPAQGNFTLYYIQTRTFWSQIATIWEWFIANFNSESLAQGHTRPVWVYDISDSDWSGPTSAQAQLALEPAVLTLGDQHIDRDTLIWTAKDTGKELGFCQRMPLWESIDTINAQAPGEPT